MCQEGWGVFGKDQKVVILSIIHGGYAYDSDLESVT